MKKYENPEIRFETLDVEDVITASNNCDPDCIDAPSGCNYDTGL